MRSKIKHPCTAEIDYTQDEIAFSNAIDRYKREHGKRFLTNRELLEILASLGYRRPLPPAPKERRAGAVAVEMALCLPILCFFFLAGIDLWRLSINQSSTQTMATAGALYGSQNPTNASNQSGIAAAANNNQYTDQPPTIQSGTYSNGDTEYVYCQVQTPFSWYTPGMSNSTITAKRTFPVTPAPTK